MSDSLQKCAGQMLEAVPLVMAAIRAEMRSHRGADLSVPQFRVLVYLQRQAGASLSAIAEHMGLTLPSMSKMIDGLVARALVARQLNPADRRRVTLAPTDSGRQTMQAAHNATAARLAARLTALSPSERRTIGKAMQVLATVFAPGCEATGAVKK
jgi:DNA-binding MarR family transcriptional regulator